MALPVFGEVTAETAAEQLPQIISQSAAGLLWKSTIISAFQPPFPLFAEAAAYKDTNCDGGFYVNGFHVMISPTTTDPQIVGWLYWEKS